MVQIKVMLRYVWLYQIFSLYNNRSKNGHKCWYILANQNAIKATILIENYNEVLILTVVV